MSKISDGFGSLGNGLKRGFSWIGNSVCNAFSGRNKYYAIAIMLIVIVAAGLVTYFLTKPDARVTAVESFLDLVEKMNTEEISGVIEPEARDVAVAAIESYLDGIKSIEFTDRKIEVDDSGEDRAVAKVSARVDIEFEDGSITSRIMDQYSDLPFTILALSEDGGTWYVTP